MTYPNGPYGQGFPEEPGYPQQGGYPPQPPYPPQGYPQPGYPQQPAYPQQGGYPGGYQQGGYPGGYQPVPQAPVSGTTGIIAAILAGLGTLANLGGGLFGLIGLVALSGDSSSFPTSSALSGGVFALLVFVVLLGVAAGLLLLAGTVTLLQRRMIGRWLVVGGCAVVILSSLLTLGLSSAATARYGYYGGNGSAIVGLIFPIVTIVLTLLPSTTAWIQARQNPVTAPYYPPYQG